LPGIGAIGTGLQKRLAALPFKVIYQEEQHGSVLVALIDCTPSQEKLVRDLMHDMGISAASQESEDLD
jgi:hypothetical protein